MMMRQDARLDAYIRDSRPHFEEMLAEMVQIPSISMDPRHAPDIFRMASLAVQFLRGLGADAQVVRTKGYPVVSGGWTTGKQHHTLMIYNHLDVQPAQEPEWRQPPFAFQKTDGIYHGRGTTDDKGPALTALLAARYAVEQGIPINIRFLWELEEEIGSPNFSAAIADDKLIRRPDSVLVSDTIWIAKSRPAMPYGLRGLVAAMMLCRRAERRSKTFWRRAFRSGGSSRRTSSIRSEPRILSKCCAGSGRRRHLKSMGWLEDTREAV